MEAVVAALKQEQQEIKGYQIDAVLTLLNEGNTIPFIARYRKEMTGSLDEVAIQTIQERYTYLSNLEKRKEEILRLIAEQGKLTEELAEKIQATHILNQLEDLYRPYKQKKRTKATLAKEKGLEPLAQRFLELGSDFTIAETESYLNAELELNTVADVLAGVHEILAEVIGDEARYRDWIRKTFVEQGSLASRVKDGEKDERHVYEIYYEFNQTLKRLPSHRILAMNRGEKEDILRISLDVDEAVIMAYFEKKIIGSKGDHPATPYLREAYVDSYKRFIKPAIERELRNSLTEKAEKQAIAVFGENLQHLLLQPPLKGKSILGFDPAYRTGCKLAVVDETGKVLHVAVIYPHEPTPQEKRQKAQGQFIALMQQFNVDTVAIGNGTASRESEQFVATALREADLKAQYVIVNEAGASVYSASEAARKEFPDLQVEERSAISIARRLQDPLAELVKIDPKSVGVGQYQHDVSQKLLNEQLQFVVETTVNKVGVDVNTASVALLEYISGLTKTTANNIVTMREEQGIFKDRESLKQIPRLGPKSYEQAIGFLRIPQGHHVLDNTAIHPESYPMTYRLLKDLKIAEADLGTPQIQTVLHELKARDLAVAYDVGVETMQDILASLVAPGRDMRDSMSGPLLRSDVLVMEDLKPGMELKGTVRNVVDFGAFVDIGVKQDGLVHISKLSSAFVKHPKDVVSVGDIVTVWVEDVDLQKQRIQLTMIPQN